MEDLRDSVQVQRGRVRGNTPEGADFFFFFSHKSQAWFFFFCVFLRGLLGEGTFVVRRTDLLEVHSTGGRERALLICFLSNCQRHLVTDTGC